MKKAKVTDHKNLVRDLSTTAIVNTDTFPKGVTIYGRWTAVTLNTGKAICYVAPATGAHPGLSTSAT